MWYGLLWGTLYCRQPQGSFLPDNITFQPPGAFGLPHAAYGGAAGSYSGYYGTYSGRYPEYYGGAHGTGLPEGRIIDLGSSAPHRVRSHLNKAMP